MFKEMFISEFIYFIKKNILKCLKYVKGKWKKKLLKNVAHICCINNDKIGKCLSEQSISEAREYM